MELTYLSTQVVIVLISLSSVSAQGESSCVGRCGEGYFRGDPCHCDFNCMSYMECCPDYKAVCTTESSCKGRCHEGFIRGQACDCDPSCVSYGRCCPDYEESCVTPEPVQKPAPPPPPIAEEKQNPPTDTTRKPDEDEDKIQDMFPKDRAQRDEAVPRKPPKKPQKTPRNKNGDIVNDSEQQPKELLKDQTPKTIKPKVLKRKRHDHRHRPEGADPSERTKPSSLSFPKNPGKRIPENSRRRKISKLIIPEDVSEDPSEGTKPSSLSSPKKPGKRIPESPRRRKISKVIIPDEESEELPKNQMSKKTRPGILKKKNDDREEPEDRSVRTKPSSLSSSKKPGKKFPESPRKKKTRKFIISEDESEDPSDGSAPSQRLKLSSHKKLKVKSTPNKPKKKKKRVVFTYEDETEDPNQETETSPSNVKSLRPSKNKKKPEKKIIKAPKKKTKSLIESEEEIEESEESSSSFSSSSSSKSVKGSKKTKKLSRKNPKKKKPLDEEDNLEPDTPDPDQRRPLPDDGNNGKPKTLKKIIREEEEEERDTEPDTEDKDKPKKPKSPREKEEDKDPKDPDGQPKEPLDSEDGDQNQFPPTEDKQDKPKNPKNPREKEGDDDTGDTDRKPKEPGSSPSDKEDKPQKPKIPRKKEGGEDNGKPKPKASSSPPADKEYTPKKPSSDPPGDKEDSPKKPSSSPPADKDSPMKPSSSPPADKEDMPKKPSSSLPADKEETPKRPSSSQPPDKEESPKKPSGSQPADKEDSPKKPGSSQPDDKEDSPNKPSSSQPADKEDSPNKPNSSQPDDKEDSPNNPSGSQPSDKEDTPKIPSSSQPVDKEDTPNKPSSSQPADKEDSPNKPSSSQPVDKEDSPNKPSSSQPDDKEDSPNNPSGSQPSDKEDTPKIPSSSQPVDKEDTPNKPSSSQPAGKEDSPNKPGSSQPADKEDSPNKPSSSQPADKEDSPNKPSSSQHADKEDSPNNPSGSQPSDKEDTPKIPSSSQPADKEDSPMKPSGAQPADKEDSPKKPGSSQPVDKEDTPNKPSSSQPADKEDSPKKPSGSQPADKEDSPKKTGGSQPDDKEDSPNKPGSSQPGDKEDSPNKPGSSQPADKEDSPSKPSSSQPADKEDSPSKPGSSQPADKEDTPKKPSSSQPADKEDSPKKPGGSQPDDKEDSPNKPGSSQPGDKEDSPNKPGSSQPGDKEDSPNKPGSSQPADKEDSPSKPSSSQPADKEDTPKKPSSSQPADKEDSPKKPSGSQPADKDDLAKKSITPGDKEEDEDRRDKDGKPKAPSSPPNGSKDKPKKTKTPGEMEEDEELIGRDGKPEATSFQADEDKVNKRKKPKSPGEREGEEDTGNKERKPKDPNQSPLSPTDGKANKPKKSKPGSEKEGDVDTGDKDEKTKETNQGSSRRSPSRLLPPDGKDVKVQKPRTPKEKDVEHMEDLDQLQGDSAENPFSSTPKTPHKRLPVKKIKKPIKPTNPKRYKDEPSKPSKGKKSPTKHSSKHFIKKKKKVDSEEERQETVESEFSSSSQSSSSHRRSKLTSRRLSGKNKKNINKKTKKKIPDEEPLMPPKRKKEKEFLPTRKPTTTDEGSGDYGSGMEFWQTTPTATYTVSLVSTTDSKSTIRTSVPEENVSSSTMTDRSVVTSDKTTTESPTVVSTEQFSMRTVTTMNVITEHTTKSVDQTKEPLMTTDNPRSLPVTTTSKTTASKGNDLETSIILTSRTLREYINKTIMDPSQNDGSVVEHQQNDSITTRNDSVNPPVYKVTDKTTLVYTDNSITGEEKAVNNVGSTMSSGINRDMLALINWTSSTVQSVRTEELDKENSVFFTKEENSYPTLSSAGSFVHTIEQDIEGLTYVPSELNRELSPGGTEENLKFRLTTTVYASTDNSLMYTLFNKSAHSQNAITKSTNNVNSLGTISKAEIGSEKSSSTNLIPHVEQSEKNHETTQIPTNLSTSGRLLKTILSTIDTMQSMKTTVEHGTDNGLGNALPKELNNDKTPTFKGEHAGAGTTIQVPITNLSSTTVQTESRQSFYTGQTNTDYLLRAVVTEGIRGEQSSPINENVEQLTNTTKVPANYSSLATMESSSGHSFRPILITIGTKSSGHSQGASLPKDVNISDFITGSKNRTLPAINYTHSEEPTDVNTIMITRELNTNNILPAVVTTAMSQGQTSLINKTPSVDQAAHETTNVFIDTSTTATKERNIESLSNSTILDTTITDQSPADSLPKKLSKEPLPTVAIDAVYFNDNISNSASTDSSTSSNGVTEENKYVLISTVTTAVNPEQTNPINETPSKSETVIIPEASPIPLDKSTAVTLEQSAGIFSNSTRLGTKSTDPTQRQSRDQSPTDSLSKELNEEPLPTTFGNIDRDNILPINDYVTSSSPAESSTSPNVVTGESNNILNATVTDANLVTEKPDVKPTENIHETSQMPVDESTTVTMERDKDSSSSSTTLDTKPMDVTERQTTGQLPTGSLLKELSKELLATVDRDIASGKTDYFNDGMNSTASTGYVTNSSLFTEETKLILSTTVRAALSPITETPSKSHTVITTDTSHIPLDEATAFTVEETTGNVFHSITLGTKSTDATKGQHIDQATTVSLSKEINEEKLPTTFGIVARDSTVPLNDYTISTVSRESSTSPSMTTEDTINVISATVTAASSVNDTADMKQTGNIPETSQVPVNKSTTVKLEFDEDSSYRATSIDTANLDATKRIAQSPTDSFSKELSKELLPTMAGDIVSGNTVYFSNGIHSTALTMSRKSSSGVNEETKLMLSTTVTEAGSTEQSSTIYEALSERQTYVIPETTQIPVDKSTTIGMESNKVHLASSTKLDITAMDATKRSDQSQTDSLPKELSKKLLPTVPGDTATGNDGIRSAAPTELNTISSRVTEENKYIFSTAVVGLEQTSQINEAVSKSQTVLLDTSQINLDKSTTATVEGITANLPYSTALGKVSTDSTNRQSADQSPTASLHEELNEDTTRGNDGISSAAPTELNTNSSRVTEENTYIFSTAVVGLEQTSQINEAVSKSQIVLLDTSQINLDKSTTATVEGSTANLPYSTALGKVSTDSTNRQSTDQSPTASLHKELNEDTTRGNDGISSAAPTELNTNSSRVTEENKYIFSTAVVGLEQTSQINEAVSKSQTVLLDTSQINLDKSTTATVKGSTAKLHYSTALGKVSTDSTNRQSVDQSPTASLHKEVNEDTTRGNDGISSAAPTELNINSSRVTEEKKYIFSTAVVGLEQTSQINEAVSKSQTVLLDTSQINLDKSTTATVEGSTANLHYSTALGKVSTDSTNRQSADQSPTASLHKEVNEDTTRGYDGISSAAPTELNTNSSRVTEENKYIFSTAVVGLEQTSQINEAVSKSQTVLLDTSQINLDKSTTATVKGNTANLPYSTVLGKVSTDSTNRQSADQSPTASLHKELNEEQLLTTVSNITMNNAIPVNHYITSSAPAESSTSISVVTGETNNLSTATATSTVNETRDVKSTENVAETSSILVDKSTTITMEGNKDSSFSSTTLGTTTMDTTKRQTTDLSPTGSFPKELSQIQLPTVVGEIPNGSTVYANDNDGIHSAIPIESSTNSSGVTEVQKITAAVSAEQPNQLNEAPSDSQTVIIPKSSQTTLDKSTVTEMGNTGSLSPLTTLGIKSTDSTGRQTVDQSSTASLPKELKKQTTVFNIVRDNTVHINNYILSAAPTESSTSPSMVTGETNNILSATVTATASTVNETPSVKPTGNVPETSQIPVDKSTTVTMEMVKDSSSISTILATTTLDTKERQTTGQLPTDSFPKEISKQLFTTAVGDIARVNTVYFNDGVSSGSSIEPSTSFSGVIKENNYILSTTLTVTMSPEQSINVTPSESQTVTSEVSKMISEDKTTVVVERTTESLPPSATLGTISTDATKSQGTDQPLTASLSKELNEKYLPTTVGNIAIDNATVLNNFISSAVPRESSTNPSIVTGKTNNTFSANVTAALSPELLSTVNETQNMKPTEIITETSKIPFNDVSVKFETAEPIQEPMDFSETVFRPSSAAIMDTVLPLQTTEKQSIVQSVGAPFPNVLNEDQSSTIAPSAGSTTVPGTDTNSAFHIHYTHKPGNITDDIILGYVSTEQPNQGHLTQSTRDTVSLLPELLVVDHSTDVIKERVTDVLIRSSTADSEQNIRDTQKPFTERLNEGQTSTVFGKPIDASIIKTGPITSNISSSIYQEVEEKTHSVTDEMRADFIPKTSRSEISREPLTSTLSMKHFQDQTVTTGIFSEQSTFVTKDAEQLSYGTSTKVAKDSLTATDHDGNSFTNLFNKNFSTELPVSVNGSTGEIGNKTTEDIGRNSTLSTLLTKSERSLPITMGMSTEYIIKSSHPDKSTVASKDISTEQPMDTSVFKELNKQQSPTAAGEIAINMIDNTVSTTGTSFFSEDRKQITHLIITEDSPGHSVTNDVGTGDSSSISMQSKAENISQISLNSEISSIHSTAANEEVSLSHSQVTSLKNLSPKFLTYFNITPGNTVPFTNISSTESPNFNKISTQKHYGILENITERIPTMTNKAGDSSMKDTFSKIPKNVLKPSFDFSVNTTRQEQSTTDDKSDDNSSTTNSQGFQKSTKTILFTSVFTGSTKDPSSITDRFTTISSKQTTNVENSTPKASEQTDATSGHSTTSFTAQTSVLPSTSNPTTKLKYVDSVTPSNVVSPSSSVIALQTLVPLGNKTDMQMKETVTTSDASFGAYPISSISTPGHMDGVSMKTTITPPEIQHGKTTKTEEATKLTTEQVHSSLPKSTVKPMSLLESKSPTTENTNRVESPKHMPNVTPKENLLKDHTITAVFQNDPLLQTTTETSNLPEHNTKRTPDSKAKITQKPMNLVTARPLGVEEIESKDKTISPIPLDPYNICDLLKDKENKLGISESDLKSIREVCIEMEHHPTRVSTPSSEIRRTPSSEHGKILPKHTDIFPNGNQMPGLRIIQIVGELNKRRNVPLMINLTGVPYQKTNNSAAWILLLNKIKSPNGISQFTPQNLQPDFQMNLCNGQPVDGMTTLQNGSMVVFRGHYFWLLNQGGVIGNARKISEVWGIPSPIDTVFTRCSCAGKTFFFKGPQYWRFSNHVMDPGYPKEIIKGFGGLKGKINAVLSVAGFKTRAESVYFFKGGGNVQKYTFRQDQAKKCTKKKPPTVQYPIYTRNIQTVRYRYPRDIIRQRIKIHRTYTTIEQQSLGVLHEEVSVKSTWRGIPNNIISAISLPNLHKPDGYDYFVFTKEKYYNINMSSKTAVKPPPQAEQKLSKDWFNCKE